MSLEGTGVDTSGGTRGAVDAPEQEPPPEPVVRTHEVMAGGKRLAYTTTAGMLPVRNDKGEIEANLFFTAYTLAGPDGGAHRPLTFTFNGGPGSAAVWLHMGGLAPKRVQMLDDGGMPRPPFTLIDNDSSWLGTTDLVFIDPVDTGYSRATSDAFAKNPYLHLFVASGYYDLATPYYATLYTVNHMNLEANARGNIVMEEYPVGHMVYLEKEALSKLQRDVAAFIPRALLGRESLAR